MLANCKPAFLVKHTRYAARYLNPRERIIFAPGYMHLMFKYYWRDLQSDGVSKPAELDQFLIGRETAGRLWVVEDYRWVHGHGGVAHPALSQIAVSGADRARVKVFTQEARKGP